MANATYPVTQDGDAVVKQYSSITINAGDTVTVDNRCKGLIIYCKGDCTIDGTLSMTEKGAKSDAPGAPDINPAGIRWVWYNPGSSDGPVSGPDVPLEALGPAAEAISNGGAWGRSDVVLTTSAFAGGSGSSSPDSGNTPWGSQSDRVGGTATNGTGGGGAAAGYNGGGTGGNGMSWGGGGGGGGAGAGGSGIPGTPSPGDTYGGNGGSGPEATRVGGGGGAGAPAGEGAPDPDGNGQDGGGTGGLLCLFVRGNLTIGPTGSVQANGGAGGPAGTPGGGSNGSGGGGSGGGRLIIVHAGTYTNNGSVTADGGEGGGGGNTNPTASAPGPDRARKGGAGSVTVTPVAIPIPAA